METIYVQRLNYQDIMTSKKIQLMFQNIIEWQWQLLNPKTIKNWTAAIFEIAKESFQPK